MAGGPLSFRVIMWLRPKEAMTSWHSQFQLQMSTGHFLLMCQSMGGEEDITKCKHVLKVTF